VVRGIENVVNPARRGSFSATLNHGEALKQETNVLPLRQCLRPEIDLKLQAFDGKAEMFVGLPIKRIYKGGSQRLHFFQRCQHPWFQIEASIPEPGHKFEFGPGLPKFLFSLVTALQVAPIASSL